MNLRDRAKSGGKGADSKLAALRTTLKIYNILGQEVITLVDEPKQEGYYSVSWDGRDYQREDVTSGLYFYRLRAGDFVVTKKMVLIR